MTYTDTEVKHIPYFLYAGSFLWESDVKGVLKHSLAAANLK